jgi:hypothetical protein
MGSVTVKRFRGAAFLLALTGALVAAFAPTGHVMEPSVHRRADRDTLLQHQHVPGRRIVGPCSGVGASAACACPGPDPLPGGAHRLSRAALGGVLGRDVVRRDLFVPAAIVMTIAAAWHESAPVPPMPSNRTTDWCAIISVRAPRTYTADH